MARFYAAEDEAGRLGLYATLYRAFAAMAVALPLVAGALLLLLPISAPLKLAMGAGLVSITARSLLKMAQERRRAAGEVRGYAVFDMAQTGGGFALGAVFAILHLGGASPLLGAGVASAACLLFALPSELRPARQGRFEVERLRRYAAYCLPISLSLLMGPGAGHHRPFRARRLYERGHGGRLSRGLQPLQPHLGRDVHVARHGGRTRLHRRPRTRRPGDAGSHRRASRPRSWC